MEHYSPENPKPVRPNIITTTIDRAWFAFLLWVRRHPLIWSAVVVVSVLALIVLNAVIRG